MHDDYDRTSKWMIQHHGNLILRLGGVEEIAWWRPLQAEVVQPRQLPDGLIEMKRSPEAESEYFILELATRPETRLSEQVLRDMALVYLDRGKPPEVLTVMLHRQGYRTIPNHLEVRSPREWTQWQIQWKMLRLWEIAAESLLDTGDLGVIPWVPLTQFEGPPDPILAECRRQIDARASPDERANLLAVTQILTRLRYNDPKLLEIFGGVQAMIDTSLIQDVLAYKTRLTIIDFLVARFGPEAHEVESAIQPIEDEARLKKLVKLAAVCPDLEAFRRGIPKPRQKRKGSR
jgi:hypothetical protein